MTVQCDAQSIPFAEASFDCVTVAFGVRNMTDKAKALEILSILFYFLYFTHISFILSII